MYFSEIMSLINIGFTYIFPRYHLWKVYRSILDHYAITNSAY
jgi:hypothetical protein